MIIVTPVGRVSDCVENFDVPFFWVTIDVVDLKLYLVVVLVELYLFMSLSVTLAICEGHSSVKQFFTKKNCVLTKSWLSSKFLLKNLCSC